MAFEQLVAEAAAKKEKGKDKKGKDHGSKKTTVDPADDAPNVPKA
jgi:hypothetical protein